MKQLAFKRVLSILLTLSLAVALLPFGVFAAEPGHWAISALEYCRTHGITDRGDMIEHLDEAITRAKFLQMINRTFGYDALPAPDPSGYEDVSPDAWYAGDIEIARALKIIYSYREDVMIAAPEDIITREQAAFILHKILRLTSPETTSKFNDIDNVSDWAEPAVKAMEYNRYIIGYNNNFMPKKPLSLGEAAQLLFNVTRTILDETLDAEGETYRHVVIRKPGVTLQNAKISGDLFITEGVGDGDVWLENVTISGRLLVAGGGENTIHLKNVTVGDYLLEDKKPAAGVQPVRFLFYHTNDTLVIYEGTVQKIIIKDDDIILLIDKGAKVRFNIVEPKDPDAEQKIDIHNGAWVDEIVSDQHINIIHDDRVGKVDMPDPNEPKAPSGNGGGGSVVTEWPTASPSSIVYGSAILSSIKLEGGKATTDGDFVWKTPGIYPKVNNSGYEVDFVSNGVILETKLVDIEVTPKPVPIASITSLDFYKIYDREQVVDKIKKISIPSSSGIVVNSDELYYTVIGDFDDMYDANFHEKPSHTPYEVYVRGIELGGNDEENYELTGDFDPYIDEWFIKQRLLKVTGATHTKEYDGTDETTPYPPIDPVTIDIDTQLSDKWVGTESSLYAIGTIEAKYKGTDVGSDGSNKLDITKVELTRSDGGVINYKIPRNNDVEVAGITPKEIIITPTALSKTYGDTETLACSYSGEVGSEIPHFTGFLSREEGDDVGSYKINLGSLTLIDNGIFKASNYSLKLDTTPVYVTITPADYTITISATQDYKMNTGLTSITVGVNGITKGSGVNGEPVAGTLTWYSNPARTTAAVDTDLSTVLSDGTVTLYWRFEATNGNYTTTAKEGSTVFTALPGEPRTLSFAQGSVNKTYGDDAFYNAATPSDGGGAITYDSSNSAVATVDPDTGEVTIVGAGTAVITAVIAAVLDDWLSATNNYTLTVAPKQLTWGANGTVVTKTYDGNNTATVATQPDLGGVINLDTVTVTNGTVTFNNANAGTAKTITVSGTWGITGANAANYTAPTGNPTFTTGTISPATLTITGATHTKVYDGTDTASGITTLTMSGYENGEDIDALGTLTVTAEYDSTNAGTTTLGVTAVTYTGAQNYTITVPQHGLTVAGITTKDIEITGATITPQVYTGASTLLPAAVTAVTFSGNIPQTALVLNSTFSVTAAAFTGGDYNAGTGKPTTITVALFGAAATNYNLTNPTFTGTTAEITKAPGAAVSGSPTVNGKPRFNSITVNTVTNTSGTGQTVEYAISKSSTAPTSGWQDAADATITFYRDNNNQLLVHDTDYYVFARTKSNGNYQAGTAQQRVIATDHATEVNNINIWTMDWTLTSSYVLVENITLSAGWTPISNFIGTFDGQGFTISGLDCSLFGVVSGDGTVRNVGIVGSTPIKSSGGVMVVEAPVKREAVGGIAGINFGIIEFCYTEVNITYHTDDTNQVIIGSIVGWNAGFVNNCVALNEYIHIHVDSGNFGRVVGYNDAGYLGTGETNNNYANVDVLEKTWEGTTSNIPFSSNEGVTPINTSWTWESAGFTDPCWTDNPPPNVPSPPPPPMVAQSSLDAKEPDPIEVPAGDEEAIEPDNTEDDDPTDSDGGDDGLTPQEAIQDLNQLLSLCNAAKYI
ncbi:MAG: YDG domain-containing protein [Oscillospiraceae bacterium]|nr:YDG domain-containing protein [Oscillospiraceae bacterium]